MRFIIKLYKMRIMKLSHFTYFQFFAVMEITNLSCPIKGHSVGHNMGHQRLSSSSLKGTALYMDLETTKWVWCRTLGSHWNFCNRYSAKTPLANLKIGAKTRMAPRTTQMTMRPFANKLGNNKASLTYKN